jgi:hypothetical protein
MPEELDQSLSFEAACLHKSSVVAVGTGVAYASNDGLVLVNSSGARNLTADMFRKEQWAALLSPGMQAIFHDGRYIVFASRPEAQGWMLELDEGSANFSKLSGHGRAPHVDRDADAVHFVPRDADGRFLERWVFDAAANRSAEWTSKVFTLPKPVNFGCAQVFAESYPLGIEVAYALPTAATDLGPASSQGQTPAAPNQSYALTVHGPDPFRLPAGFLSREWSVSFTASSVVTSCILAESMDEIRKL